VGVTARERCGSEATVGLYLGQEFVGQAGEGANAELELCQLALGSTHEGIIIHRLDGTLVMFNRAAAVNLGYTPEDFAKLPPWGWTPSVPPDQRAKTIDRIVREESHTFLSERTLPTGEFIVMEVRSRHEKTQYGDLIISVSHEVTERVRAETMLRDLAFHDALTGLANRVAFDERLDAAISSVRRHGDYLGLIYLDIDDFKAINDSYGHGVGDSVLIATAHRLEGAVRSEDVVARLGGDEFVVILPRLDDPNDVERVAAKLRGAIAKPLKVTGRIEFNLSAATGTAVFERDTDDARSFVARADIDMYESKKRERGVP